MSSLAGMADRPYNTILVASVTPPSLAPRSSLLFLLPTRRTRFYLSVVPPVCRTRERPPVYLVTHAMDLSFDSVDSVYELMDWTYDLTNLQYEPTTRESDLTDYNVSTASVCAQTETFDSVDSVYQSMEPTYGLSSSQCKPTSFSPTPTNSEHDWKDFDSYAPTEEPFEQTEGKVSTRDRASTRGIET
ncbi:hypothetical protein BC629DRAFT_770984 [Irpex lacteus]|nr:hypothetical protein BC629DRAFT_770984 [Irpex lacteus]